MATSSIFHNFLLDDEETIIRFIDAFDASMDEEQPTVPDNIHIVRDKEELEELFAKQDKYLEARRQRRMLINNVRTVNIRDYFGTDENMKELQEYIEIFSCPRNPSIERFLKRSAINFTKQDTSVTYLAFSAETSELLGYFSLAFRPIEVPADRVSKSIGRRIKRAGRFDRQANIYNAAAYLIAQLGKNYPDGANERISGGELLGAAWNKLREIQYHAVWSIAFLEAEDVPELLDFYTRNNFRVFSQRGSEEGRLIQYVRAVKQ